jgi:hypothetical protein
LFVDSRISQLTPLLYASKAMGEKSVVSYVARVPALLYCIDCVYNVGGMCTLEVWIEVSSQGRRFIRSRITDDPTELPDCAYRIDFVGYRVMTHKFRGLWELSFLSPDAVAKIAGDLRDRGAA